MKPMNTVPGPGATLLGHAKASGISNTQGFYEVLKKILSHTGTVSEIRWTANVRSAISAVIDGKENAISRLFSELESIGNYEARVFSLDLRAVLKAAPGVVAPAQKPIQPTISADRKSAQRKREQAVTCGRVSKYQRDGKTGAGKKTYPMPDDVLAVLTLRFPVEYMCELLESLIDCGKETRSAIRANIERRKKAMFQKEGS